MDGASHPRDPLPPPGVTPLALLDVPEVRQPASFQQPLDVRVRELRLAQERPWVRSLGKLAMEVRSQGFRFPAPPMADDNATQDRGDTAFRPRISALGAHRHRKRTRLKPSADVVLLKERLLYLLQPPLESLFNGREVPLPCQPYPYQMEGIAFLMPRWSAVLADEMGLGKTMQAIVAIRLLLRAGLVRSVLVVCPKSLVGNWARELRAWAEDLPFEIIGGDADARRIGWLVSNSPVKLVNYELLTRDADHLADAAADVHFDLVVLDEAQRIKNREARTAQVVRGIRRQRSWALTGTPIENRPEDLINLFAFVKPGAVPADTPVRRLPDLTGDFILRRCKEDVLPDLPSKIIRDAYLELTVAQREAYTLAERQGVVHLNELGDTITVQHVFELVMRLKQICNFDPLTGQSAKLEQLLADLEEVADSGRKAIVFSQWVEPLEWLAQRLGEFGPLRCHGRLGAAERQAVLNAFRDDPGKHVLLMSYGVGSLGLNLQFANYVFLFDRWWNPAVEDQAINRAHRIGQKEPVFVTRFVTQNTIEGRICEVLERKRQLFIEVIGQSETPAPALSEEEIFGLFDLTVRPARGRSAA